MRSSRDYPAMTWCRSRCFLTTARIGRRSARREISCTFVPRIAPVNFHPNEESFTLDASAARAASAKLGILWGTARRASPASRKERREDFMTGYFLKRSSNAWRASLWRGGADGGADPAAVGCE
jgi:hypothetical protein